MSVENSKRSSIPSDKSKAINHVRIWVLVRSTSAVILDLEFKRMSTVNRHKWGNMAHRVGHLLRMWQKTASIGEGTVDVRAMKRALIQLAHEDDHYRRLWSGCQQNTARLTWVIGFAWRYPLGHDRSLFPFPLPPATASLQRNELAQIECQAPNPFQMLNGWKEAFYSNAANRIQQMALAQRVEALAENAWNGKWLTG